MAQSKYDTLIRQSALKAGIDPDLFHAQLAQESGLNPEASSPKGAIGIAQIVPKWWLGKHGLNTVEDIKDPAKAIPAAAQIMADAQKQYGSWNAALVAYNAGPGKNNKYINAVNQGRFEVLPQETQDYVRKLGVDVPPAPKNAPGVISASAPEVGPLGQRQLSATPNWQPDRGEQQAAWESFKSGLSASTIGTALRRDDPSKQFLPTSYEFDNADLDAIRAADIGEAGARFVMRNAFEKKDVQELIRLAQENRAASTQNRSLVGNLSYGLGEMAGDPVTYGTMVIPGGIYGRAAGLFNGTAAKVAAGTLGVASEGALQNLASEALRETTTGTDADYQSALMSGAVGGVAIHGAVKGIGKGYDAITRGLNRVESSNTARVLQTLNVEGVRDPSHLTPLDIDQLTGIQWREHVNQPGSRPLVFQDQPHAGFQRDPMGVLLGLPNGDTIHPASGLQYSSHNPLNPAYTEPVDINLAGAPTAEIGDIVASSKVPEFKSMAWDLVRSTKGYTDGSAGKFGVTAQDVEKVMKGQHFDFQLKYEDIRSQAMADPMYVGNHLSTYENRLQFDERVMRAVETGDVSNLIPAEIRAVELRKARYQELANDQVNPGAKWGTDSRPLLDEASVRENYQPIVYDEVKLSSAKEQYGEETVREMVSRSFYGSYQADKVIRQRVDEYLASLPEKMTAKEYADRVAYGIVSAAEDNALTTSALAAHLDGHSVANIPDFRKMRSPFGYNHEITLPDGSKFSVSDLRSFDSNLIDTAYANRVKGDVAIMVGTGRTPEEMKQWLAYAAGRAEIDPNLKSEVLSFEKIVAGMYGRGIRNGNARLAAVQGMFQDLAFVRSSAGMGLLNYAEIASGIQKNGVGFAMRSVPVIGDFFTSMMKGHQTAKAMRTAQNIVWGSSLDRAILPTYREAINHATARLVRESGDNATNRIIGTVAGSTKALAERFWTSRVLNATTGQIIGQARGEFFADMARNAHGIGKTSFASAKRAAEASVSPEQLAGIQSLLRETTRVTRGQLEITNPVKLANDPRVAALRRYGQFWSERVIQQNTIGSTFRWSHLPVVGMLTQFMSFVTRSVNARLIRGVSDVFRNGNTGEAIALGVVAPTITAMGYAGISYLQSLKFDTAKDRKKFLQERLGDGEDFGPLIAGTVKRMPIAGGGSWLYDSIGTTGWGQAAAPEFFKYAGMGKTSTEAKLRKDAQAQKGPVGSLLGNAVTEAPAIKMVDSILTLPGATYNNATAETYSERVKATKALQRSLQGIVPNDPLSQRALSEFMNN